MNWGVLFTVAFVLAAVARDVLFAGIFQAYRFFDVVLVTFGLTGLLSLVLIAVRAPEQMQALRRAWQEGLIVNAGTAAAWLSFFYALKMLEPAVVNTIHTGMGSVTLVALGALGLHASAPTRVRVRERILQAGVLLSLLALAGVVLAGLSGLRDRSFEENLVGLALAFASGIFISLTSDVTKRMNERGVGPEAILAVRFWLGVAVSGGAVALGFGEGAPLAEARALATVAVAGLALIALPLYLFQLGLARISAISVWVIQAVGPCLVFAAQLLDGRLQPSPYSLAAIALYSVLVMAAALVRTYERA